MGKYDDIASAGDAGWLALINGKKWKNNGKEYIGIDGGKQYLLDERGDVIKEFSGTYEKCFGNKYLIRYGAGPGIMGDSRGGETCEVAGSLGEIYDLDENLLLSAPEGSYLQYLIDGNMLAVFGVGQGGLNLLDMGGNIITKISSSTPFIVEPMMDVQKIVLNKGGESKLVEFDLASGTMTEMQFHNEDEWDAQIIEEKSGDFSQLYKDGELLFDERFAECSFRDGVLFLKNIDSQWGIADYDGNIIIPFGGIADEHSLSEGGGILTSRGMFGFYKKQGGNFEVHNFKVPEGRLPQIDRF